ncbi:MAG: hypothetical protein ACO33A_00735 [Hyphomonas sp.]
MSDDLFGHGSEQNTPRFLEPEGAARLGPRQTRGEQRDDRDNCRVLNAELTKLIRLLPDGIDAGRVAVLQRTGHAVASSRE